MLFRSSWLMRTVNRETVFLELGAGFLMPQATRWPFERMVQLNQKSFLIRVNGTFPQIPETIPDRYASIREDSVEWLQHAADEQLGENNDNSNH